MRILRLFFSIFLGVLVTFIVTFIIGNAGVIQYLKLEEQKKCLENNIEQLKINNKKLSLELELLMKDEETVQLLARQFGYFEHDDEIVSISGFLKEKSYYEIGMSIHPIPEERDNSHFFQVFGIILPALLYIILTIIIKMIRDGHKKNR